ncbi:hypothetical protein AVEN_172007-1 [Araneus ventricosus]|uniref:sn-1-specific diacylglycerol lipase ABHD11 n=1 Tax=Araneus ventricosus TaxID=182803 RepID=A0A4Y2IUW8_ARAVE|nr:hypothetical protein AVEN_172007-1 [Araneus ventricosus]
MANVGKREAEKHRVNAFSQNEIEHFECCDDDVIASGELNFENHVEERGVTLKAYNLVEPDGGATDKPPVIILHGVTASKEYWYDIPKTVANATKRKVYAVDARNHGESPWSEVFDFGDCNVVDLLHFMDTIKAPKAILIGHSMGGITIIKTAIKASIGYKSWNKLSRCSEIVGSVRLFVSGGLARLPACPMASGPP